LEQWLDRGCKISYTLVCPDPNSTALLRRLSAKYPLLFSLCLVSATSDKAPSVEAMVEKYKTFHPVLLQTKDGQRVMWIEHYHPLDSALAFNIEFIAPPEAAKDSRFDKFKKDIALIQEACPQEKSPAPLDQAA
jgi:hypothetical protein